MSRLIIDARSLAEHPQQFQLEPGLPYMLHQMTLGFAQAGHQTHVVLGGAVEMFRDGISYWPTDRFPHSGDALFRPQKAQEGLFNVSQVWEGADLYQTLPGCDNHPVREKIPGRLVWAAGVNRGLWHLMDMWPALKERVPSISLTVLHDPMTYCRNMKWQHDYQGLQAIKLQEWFENDSSVSALQKLTRDDAIEQVAMAELYVYPCDPITPSKGHRSMSVMDAAAEGCALILSPEESLYDDFEGVGAFLESPWHHDNWVEVVVDFLTDAVKRQEWALKARKFARKNTWAKFQKEWNQLVEVGDAKNN